jgi:hypothetical protein
MWRAVLLAMVLLGGAMPALATPQRQSVNEDGTVQLSRHHDRDHPGQRARRPDRVDRGGCQLL